MWCEHRGIAEWIETLSDKDLHEKPPVMLYIGSEQARLRSLPNRYASSTPQVRINSLNMV